MVNESSWKQVVQQAAESLSGHAKRLFMATTVNTVFEGKPFRAARVLGWNRQTIDKGLHELKTGIECVDGRRGTTGKKPAEARLSNLLTDIRDVIDSQSQTDARFRTQRLYTRMSANEVRKQLIVQKGYADEELPKERTILEKLNQLGYRPVRVQKTQVKKRSQPQTRFSTK